MFMEEANNIVTEATDLIVKKCESKGCKLSERHEDFLWDTIKNILEEYAGEYRHHM